MTKEERMAAGCRARQRIQAQDESSARVNDAANRILEVSSQLHLTWDELERAISVVKKRGCVVSREWN